MNEPNDLKTFVERTLILPATQERVFEAWTREVHLWWPQGHRPCGDAQSTLSMEHHKGGRFFARTTDGVEFEMGEVLVWEPPERLEMSWFLGSNPDLPSRVTCTFTALDSQRTQLHIVHRGPEHLGALWLERVDKFEASWIHVTRAFKAHIVQ